MKYSKLILALAVVTLLGTLSPKMLSAKPPQPNAAESKWQVDISYKHPKPVWVTTTSGKKELYWYFLFTVTNRTGKDIDPFALGLELYTNTGQLMRANQGCDALSGFNTVQKFLNNPMLKQFKTGNKLIQGEDNAVEMVVFFKDFDPKATSFKLFVTGLSGEVVEMKLDKEVDIETVDDEGKLITVKSKIVTLKKTLELNYKLGAEATARDRAEVKYDSKRWIMR